MTSYTLQVQPRRSYTIEYSNQRGPQGAAGAAGPATTDASLLVSGTLSDARLSSNVALENVANVFTAKQSFSGTDHVGLCLQSLTTAQYNALTPANGDIFRDSTTDRIDARLARGTVELIDSAGGQTINGALTVGNTIQFSNATDNVAIRIGTYVANFGSLSFTASTPTANTVTLWGNANNTAVVLNTADYTYFRRLNATQFQISPSGVEFVSNIGLGANTLFAFSSTSDPMAAKDLSFTRSSAGVARIGNGSANASGSLLLTNLTASGTLRVGGGTVVASILSATATLDFPSIGSNGTETLTITVTGAVAGDSVFLGCPAGLDAGLVFCASVTAANTVTVRMHNSSGGSIDPASGTFRATVIRF